MDYLQLAHQIELYTGGIDGSPVIIPSLEQLDDFSFAFKFSSVCLERNVEKMIELMREIYTNVDFFSNLNYLQSCIDQSATDAASGILSNGSYYARTHAASSLSFYDQLLNSNSGIDAMKFLKQLSSEANTEQTATYLQELSKYLLRKDKMKLLITCEDNQAERVKKIMSEQFYGGIENNAVANNEKMQAHKLFKPNYVSTYLSIPSSVSFVGKAVLTAPFATKESALLRVVSSLLHSCYLHQEVRERGGAYGSNAVQGMNGVFAFSSYRDPSPLRTISVCSGAAEWIQKAGSVTSKSIQEAKLQVFQQLDAPVMPHTHAQSQVVYGINDELRQFRRSVILDATKEEIVDTCVKFLGSHDNKSSSTIIGGSFEKDIPEGSRSGWTHIIEEEAPEQ